MWNNLPLLAAQVSWIEIVLGLVSVPFFVALNGLFVAAEFALVAVRKTRITEMVRQGERRAQSVEYAVLHLDRSIAATQLGITLSSISLGWIGEPAVADLIGPAFASLPFGWRGATTHTVASVIAFTLITFMHVVFGELIPKTMALQRPDGTALRVSRFIIAFMKVSRPLILFMNGTGNIILRWLGFRPATESEMAHSIEELAMLIEDSRESGLLNRTQADVVQRAFELSNKTVRDCLVPRDKMATLDLKATPEEVLEAVRETAHTRMPVHDGHPDNIVGIVNTKDLFHIFSVKGLIILEDALYPPLFMRPDQEVATALKIFRRKHRPMAVVRDDDGRVLGLITLEDVIEELVGDIEDEHDVPAANRP
jgi:CBS domain containing-hemolysin-like protein